MTTQTNAGMGSTVAKSLRRLGHWTWTVKSIISVQVTFQITQAHYQTNSISGFQQLHKQALYIYKHEIFYPPQISCVSSYCDRQFGRDSADVEFY